MEDTAVTFVPTTNMLLVKDGKVLVIQRSNALKDFPGWYMLPGGKQEKYETPEEAAIRETREETGVNVHKAHLRVIATHVHEYKKKVYLVYIFASANFDGELVGSVEGVPEWVDVRTILEDEKLYPDLKRHIQLIMEHQEEMFFTYHRFNERVEIVETR